MNEDLQKQLVRQLKILNFWVTLFGTIVIIVSITIGILLFKTYTFVQNTADTVQELRAETAETLNVKNKVCSTSLLENRDFCQE